MTSFKQRLAQRSATIFANITAFIAAATFLALVIGPLVFTRAAGVHDYSGTAGNNVSVGGISIAEGMARASVNNAIRAQLADIANFLLDIGGSRATTGSANAYIYDAATNPTALANNFFLTVKASFANSGAATIDVESLGPVNIKKLINGSPTALASGDIPSGHRMMLLYSSGDSAWILLNPPLPMTSQGDLVVGGASAPTRLAVGSTGQYVTTADGVSVSWGTLALTTSNFAANVVDTDTALAANSDTRLTSQKAVKSYIDNAVVGQVLTSAVAVATTGNITLSGEQTLDGVLTSASRVLVWKQTTATQNGIYVSGAGAWSRATDADADAELPHLTTFVSAGTLYGGGTFTVTNSAVTLGATNIVIAQTGSSTLYSAGTGLQLVGATFSISDAEVLALAGLTSAADRVPYFTGSGTAELMPFTSYGRSLVDDADAATARTTLGVGTGDSPQFTGVEIGNASDTTLARAAAGRVTIEGVGVVRGPASATDNAVPRFDATTGDLTQNSGVVVDDSNNVSGVARLTTTAEIELGNASDTTIVRSAAGAAMIEGVAVATTTNALALTNKSYTSNSAAISLADNAATTITFNITNGDAEGLFCFMGNVNDAGLGMVAFRVGGAPSAFLMTLNGPTTVDYTTGVLSGTTGVDGHVTVSAHTDGKLYIENRTGATRTYNISILALKVGTSIASIP